MKDENQAGVRPMPTNIRDLYIQHPMFQELAEDQIRNLESVCRLGLGTDDIAAAAEMLDQEHLADSEGFYASEAALRAARAWEPTDLLPDLDDATLRQQALLKYPEMNAEEACVSFLVDTCQVKFPEVTARKSRNPPPVKLQSVAKSILWNNFYSAVVRRYPWLAYAVAHLAAERLLDVQMPTRDDVRRVNRELLYSIGMASQAGRSAGATHPSPTGS
jgi:hypothetical protein